MTFVNVFRNSLLADADQRECRFPRSRHSHLSGNLLPNPPCSRSVAHAAQLLEDSHTFDAASCQSVIKGATPPTRSPKPLLIFHRSHRLPEPLSSAKSRIALRSQGQGQGRHRKAVACTRPLLHALPRAVRGFVVRSWPVNSKLHRRLAIAHI